MLEIMSTTSRYGSKLWIDSVIRRASIGDVNLKLFVLELASTFQVTYSSHFNVISVFYSILGYMIFEGNSFVINQINYQNNVAVQWSNIHQKWFFLPRKVSYEPYNEDQDHMRGSNYLIIADEYFKVFKYIRVGNVEPSRGFSAFQFIPGTNDQMIVAFKSEELEGKFFLCWYIL